MMKKINTLHLTFILYLLTLTSFFQFPFLSLIIQPVYSQKLYLNRPYAQLLNNPYSYSSAVTTLPCATPLLVTPELKSNAVDWIGAKFADEKGYIYRPFLSLDRPSDCYQEKYPIFLRALGLDVTELFYWGRLQNQVQEFITGETL